MSADGRHPVDCGRQVRHPPHHHLDGWCHGGWYVAHSAVACLECDPSPLAQQRTHLSATPRRPDIASVRRKRFYTGKGDREDQP